MKVGILGNLLIIGVVCETVVSTEKCIPLWQKLCAIGGIVLFVMAVILYFTINRNLNLGQFIRKYVVPAQT